MPGSTYTPIATTTLGSAAATVTFSSISSSYTDIIVVVNAKASTVTNTYMQVGNGSIDSGSNYSRTGLSGNGSAASSYRGSNQTFFYCNNNSAPDASNFNYVDTIHLMNYSNTSTYKTFLNRANNAGYGVEAQVGLWRSTSAINTILLGTASGTWAVGSTFTLYGIAAA